MLVLTRKKGERIHLSGGIIITVVRTGRGTVQLGITAPPAVQIVRDDARLRERKK